MKKIAILAFGDKSAGGIYQYTQSIIDALKDENSNQYIIFCDMDDNRFDHYTFEVRKISIPQSTKFQKLIRAFQSMFFIRKPYFFQKKELALFQDIDLFISPLISAYPHFYLNKPFLFTLHDMQERYYPNYFTKKERIVRWLNNRTLAKSAVKIICESRFVKEDIVKFIGVDENKIHIIQSPPPLEFLNYHFDDAKFEDVRQKYNLPSKYLFYPAQAWFHKNHIKLIEAFKKISEEYDEIFLVLTGSQQNNFIHIMNKIKELELSDKVKHLGYIDYEDLPYLYKMSQMLVMPSLFESVSIPIYEAFVLGVPVCSSNVVALPEQVADAGILFDPNSVDDIAEKILLLLNDDELKNEKILKGYEKVVNFNHEEYRKKLLNVIND